MASEREERFWRRINANHMQKVLFAVSCYNHNNNNKACSAHGLLGLCFAIAVMCKLDAARLFAD